MFNLEIDNLAKKPYIPQKKYFYEFVANVLRDNIAILVLTSMEAVRGHTPYSDTLWNFNSMFGPSHSGGGQK